MIWLIVEVLIRDVQESTSSNPVSILSSDYFSLSRVGAIVGSGVVSLSVAEVIFEADLSVVVGVVTDVVSSDSFDCGHEGVPIVEVSSNHVNSESGVGDSFQEAKGKDKSELFFEVVVGRIGFELG
uniref:Uncharacterized protein n=1 Tax=Nelumbo nucifera TaxID=4432 RepID=A0A822XTA2_NELNU|nr:TPA_asm: hypothetical protein HUJ06_026308 [Nelumbo nucifera]